MRFSTPNRRQGGLATWLASRADPRHRSRDCEPRASASSRSTGSRLAYVTCGCIRSGDGELPARLRVIPADLAAVISPASAVRGRRREGVRQRQSAVDAAPGAGARRRDLRRGTGRAARRRVHRVAGEAGGRRSRQGGEGTGRGHGAPPARSSRRPGARRRRRARLRHRARAQRTGLGGLATQATARARQIGHAHSSRRQAHSALGRPCAH